ncbi:MAG: heat-inducible transcriptional repressor HrcA, partial [Cyanobacteria bacterium P01_H01_bin.130]
MDLNLSPRQASILKAIIRHYVATAEPVGSKVLVKEYDIGASPATVRNTMGRLEKVGLLYQPHTSAGRIPSDSGYRVYVDHYLYPIESEAIAAERDFAERILNERLSHESLGTRFRLNHLDLLLKGAAQILAELSGCIALITLPQAPLSKVHQIRLLPMEPGKIMALLVTQTYESYSSLITLSPPVSESRSPAEAMDPNPWEGLDPEHLNQELSLVSNFLSCQLQNHTVGDLSTLDWQELGKQFEHYGDFLQVLLQELSQQAIPAPSNTKIMIGGVSSVLRQPEFTELEQVQTLLHLLEEEQDHLSALIYGASPPLAQRTQRQVTVRIGSENPWEPIQNYSLISSQYGDSTNHWGSVGLLG